MSRGAKSGDNRFSSHQAEKVDLRLSLIKTVLENIKNRKMSFANKWQLSTYVCDEVNKILEIEHPEVYKKPRGKITVPTISTKNAAYSRELDKHLVAQQKENRYSEQIAATFKLELEIDELKEEITRLNKYIALLNQNSQRQTPKLAEQDTNLKTMNDGLCNPIALDACHKIILALLEASEDMLVIHESQIEDPTRTVDNVVVNKELLEKSGLLDNYLFKGLTPDR
jgi:hypothetical protein